MDRIRESLSLERRANETFVLYYEPINSDELPRIEEISTLEMCVRCYANNNRLPVPETIEDIANMAVSMDEDWILYTVPEALKMLADEERVWTDSVSENAGSCREDLAQKCLDAVKSNILKVKNSLEPKTIG